MEHFEQILPAASIVTNVVRTKLTHSQEAEQLKLAELFYVAWVLGDYYIL